MRIAYYPSFRALDHGHSSGLVSIARNVHAAMQAEGHEVFIPLTQSMEWIYLRPWRWPRTLREAWLADKTVKQRKPDCWLTYHSYYRGRTLSVRCWPAGTMFPISSLPHPMPANTASASRPGPVFS